MSNGLHLFDLYDLLDIVFMKHYVIYVFVILVVDVYCVAIHDLSPVLTALFSLNLGDLTKSIEGYTYIDYYLVNLIDSQ